VEDVLRPCPRAALVLDILVLPVGTVLIRQTVLTQQEGQRGQDRALAAYVITHAPAAQAPAAETAARSRGHRTAENTVRRCRDTVFNKDKPQIGRSGPTARPCHGGGPRSDPRRTPCGRPYQHRGRTLRHAEHHRALALYGITWSTGHARHAPGLLRPS
jgi:hypothetical protein